MTRATNGLLEVYCRECYLAAEVASLVRQLAPDDEARRTAADALEVVWCLLREQLVVIELNAVNQRRRDAS